MTTIKLKDFESTLESLNSIIENMEKGDLSLEESIKQFEKGMSLTKACQQALSQAEQKVKILLDDHDKPIDFDHKSDE
ncbi:MAG: exodeoxyribonuclease VII small subunit [Legionellales bacterium]|nr:exodeoxyribonuclease VII small subunit [Legionellales bacterium]